LFIDRDDNLWVTDVGGHIVQKLNPQGQVLLTLGTKGRPANGTKPRNPRKLNEPKACSPAQRRHLRGPRAHAWREGRSAGLKFNKNGNFIKSWGGKGRSRGRFDVAHGIALDAKGQWWVADRENQRIQIFDQDGAL